MKKIGEHPFYHSLPSWLKAITVISYQGTITISKLSEIANITNTYTSVLVKNMHQLGWIKYVPSKNKRTKPIMLTDIGYSISGKCEDLLTVLENEFKTN